MGRSKRQKAQRDGLDDLLRHPQLWRAGRLGSASEATTTGFAELDRHFPGGGWPRAGLAELLLPTAGIGELRLLVPLIRTLSREQSRWIAWIAPPFVPYAPALQACGIDLGRLLVIRPPDHQSALWAMERASRSGTCSLVLGWPDERRLELTDTRRLQLATQRGRTLTCLFRPERAAAVKSMAELRLRVVPAEPGSMRVDICKRRGGWPVAALPVRLADEPSPAALESQLRQWRTWQRQWQLPAPDVTGEAAEQTPNGPHDAHPGAEPFAGQAGIH